MIDFVLVNSLALGIGDQMQIEEQQEKIDLTDHNSIEISLKFNYMHPNYDRRGKWEEKIYYKLDEKSIQNISHKWKKISTHTMIYRSRNLNKIVGRAAEKTCMSKCKRRLLKNNQRKSPWVNDEIKKRNKIYREKRNCNYVTKRELHNKLYIKHKIIVQTKIKEQMNMHI